VPFLSFYRIMVLCYSFTLSVRLPCVLFRGVGWEGKGIRILKACHGFRWSERDMIFYGCEKLVEGILSGLVVTRHFAWRSGIRG
jgi:hypothetical protein